VAQGFTNREIAKLLTLSDRTVGNHVGNILSKLQLTNRTQAALYALDKGITTLRDNNRAREWAAF
jgi:DNA-binding NarL/FixJ family response regulator